MTRPKSFLTYFVLCAIPLLLLAGLNYWNGIRAVDSTLSAAAQDDLNSVTASVDDVIAEQERALLGLAINPDVQQQVIDKRGDPSRVTSYLDLSRCFKSLG